MATIAELNNKIKTANALGIENLSKKGVNISESATTYEIMQSIDNISSGTSGDDSYNQGYADGQKEYEQWFWDIFQYNGTRTDYQHAFGGLGWTDETFKPKYDMQPDYASRMFNTSRITDLKGVLETLGVALDFSKAASAIEFLANSSITSVGIVNTTKMSNLNQMFYLAKKLQSIEKLILKNDGSQSFNNLSFSGCNALTHIIFEGAIGSDLSLQWSPLDYESMLSIVNALVDYSGSDKAFTHTVYFNTDAYNNLTGEQQDELMEITGNKCWNL